MRRRRKLTDKRGEATPKVQEFLAKVLAKEPKPKSVFELYVAAGEVSRERNEKSGEYKFALSDEESRAFCNMLDAIGERLESQTH